VRVARRGWLLLPGALCALAAHAVAYRSFFPAGQTHRYLDWYEPALGALSLVALGLLACLAAFALSGGRLPVERPDDPWARLGGTGVALFLAQETLERSLQAGSLHPAALSATTWLAVLVAVALSAGLLALLARGAELVRLVLRRVGTPRARTAVARPRPVEVPRRRSPLADRRGLRAPPLVAG
jgi:hypothetical protein